MTAPITTAPAADDPAAPLGVALSEAPGVPLAPATEPLPLPVVGSLSPSRAGDFLTCPLLYRFRTVDRLPEPPSPAATRGTLVHAALEALFDLPAAERTPARAHELLGPAWRELQEREPEVAALFADEAELAEWLRSARDLVDAYFALEDPRRLEPAAREQLVEVLLPGGLRLRGIVDRLDVAPSGDLRIVDYKGLALDTPLATPTGWTSMAEVQVGDELLSADGRPCRVTAKSQVHERPCYEVAFTDGSVVTCDHVHLWSVHVPAGEGWEVRVFDADELFRLVRDRPRTVRGRRRPFVEATRALRLPVADLPIDPWVLGAWLGDGATRGGSMTIGHQDRDDMLRLLKEHWAGLVSIEPSSERATALTVSLLRPRPDLCPYGHDDFRDVERGGRTSRRCNQERLHAAAPRWNASLSESLTRAGLRGNKHIPVAYLRASSDQRLELLRGLVDTDGSWSDIHGRAVFVTTRDELATGVRELVHSMGGTSTVFSKPYDSARGARTAHMVVFRPPPGLNPFSLPRKAMKVDEWRRSRRESVTAAPPRELRRTIASVRPVSSVPTQCVAVDAPDSLYLCGATLIPTHNTGRAPREAFEGKALFQMKFYGLVLWRTRGVVPRLLQLMYLGDGEVLRYSPEESDLLAVERKLLALWSAIERATLLRDFRPRRSQLCEWCSHQALCPEFGGTPPPWPEQVPGPDDLLPHQQRAHRDPLPATAAPDRG